VMLTVVNVFEWEKSFRRRSLEFLKVVNRTLSLPKSRESFLREGNFEVRQGMRLPLNLVLGKV